MTKPNSSTAAATHARQIGHSDAPAGHDTSAREMTIAGHGAGINRSEIPFSEALKVWLELGLLSFGGPAGQIALMHRLVVEERRWIGEAHFLHALNYCMLLPGPEAQQLATYVGWLLHRTWGGLAAGLLFILPGAAVMAALSVAYAVYGDLFIVNALFYGIKTAVLAIVVEAAMRIGKRALKNRAMYLIALAAFVAIFLFAVPFPLIIAAAAVAGIFAANSWDPQANAEPAMEPVQTQPSARHTVLVVAVCLLLWLTPVVALVLWDGAGVYAREGLFFSKMAVVTFGGAYAVLAYVAQQAVDTFGWLLPGEMLDGLGLAETTPGPLILVVQFVGFLGAFRAPGALDATSAGMLGAALTLWVTFVPCFMWILAGAPFIERLRGNQRLNRALAAITAAVVGVVLNLALWFALHVVFAEVSERQISLLRFTWPDWTTVDWFALVLTISALIAMLRFKLGMITTLAVAAVLGVGVQYLRL